MATCKECGAVNVEVCPGCKNCEECCDPDGEGLELCEECGSCTECGCDETCELQTYGEIDEDDDEEEEEELEDEES